MVSLQDFLVLLLAGIVTARHSGRIVGGEPTTIERYPSLVQVDYLAVFQPLWFQSCAGNILTSRFILSAAHCFHGFFYLPENRRIRAGATMSDEGGVIVYVEREFNHPSYGNLGLDGDITVVQLKTSLVYSPTVQQGAIIAQGVQVPDNMPVVLAGWGAVKEYGIDSDILLHTTVYTINNDLCTERYNTLHPEPYYVTKNMICAGILDVGGRDACQGDSGGPMYFGNVIVGIISWGHGCANATFPGVATAVSSYTDWVVSIAS